MSPRVLPWLLVMLFPAHVLAQPCVDYAKAVEVGRLSDAALNELSGLARSSDGGYWAHNDSGDSARIFKLGEDGKVEGTWNMVGITAVDFEDMANAPCADGSACLMVADIGNNSKDRDVVALHRFAEPIGPGAIALIETTSFRYPDGNHDAEAVFATAEAAYVINKDGNQSRLYRVPWSPDQTVTAELVTTFAEPLTVTAADLSADGTKLLVRGYLSIAEFDVSVSLVSGFAAPPKYLPYSFDGQGEAITFTGSGGGFITISEATNAVVHRHECVVIETEADAGMDAATQEDMGSTPEVSLDMGDTQAANPESHVDDSCAGFFPLWLLPVCMRRRRER